MAKQDWNKTQIPNLNGKVIVITGATSGIGKETASVLASKNATVIIGARNEQKAQKVVDEISLAYPKANVSSRPLDLTSLDSVKQFADSILDDFSQLDMLINNAGIMACPYAETEDKFEIQVGTNHLAHFALTGRLLPLLTQSNQSRIVVLSSIAHKFGKIDINDLNWQSRKYNTNRAYGDSKLANLLFMYELVRKLEKVSNAPMVTAAHPGWTNTELQRHTSSVRFLNRFFSQDVTQGALPTLRAAFDNDAHSGDFFGPSKHFELHGKPVKVKSNKLSHDKELAEQLWTRSEELTGVYF